MLIHRYWQGSPPPFDYASEIERFNPDCTLINWTRDSIPGWILDAIDQTKQFVIEKRQHHHAANLARLGLLWEFGGQWVDYDIKPLARFPRVGAATASHANGTICNCWLSFPRKHPFLGKVIGEALDFHTKNSLAVRASGERLMELQRKHFNIATYSIEGWAVHEGWTSNSKNI